MISQLGRYEVISELGQGAMGVVYKARDPLIDRVVAIKTINLGMAQDEEDEYEGRFYQEARAAGRLNHPNIVTIYDVGKSGEIAYIAMEFLQGCELRDLMRENGRLPVDQVLDIVAQVAQGLAYAHEHEIVHRDIKPSNIMVIRDGHVKITDFGIARMASSAVRTQTGMVLGSPKYMSPEQVLGSVLDQRSDIFSLGVMLYEMLTGESPFIGDNINAIMFQTLNSEPAAPGTLNSAVPDMLNFIVAKALAKERDDRYQNARDFAEDLRACRKTLPRSDQASAVSGEERRKLAGAVVTERRKAAEQAAFSPLGLSKAFDSSEATMRLAALTTTSAEVDELSKTMKMMAAPRPAASRARPVAPARVAPLPQAGESSSHFKLAVFLLVVLLLIVVIATH
ncbi:MAG: serine/threonine-protein kinase [Proteobacteria bacterium]|nr:serine/threonine-protein kinase [Pseudomonadota bacterium]